MLSPKVLNTPPEILGARPGSATRASGLSDAETRPATLVERGPGSGRVGLKSPGLGRVSGLRPDPDNTIYHSYHHHHRFLVRNLCGENTHRQPIGAEQRHLLPHFSLHCFPTPLQTWTRHHLPHDIPLMEQSIVPQVAFPTLEIKQLARRFRLARQRAYIRFSLAPRFRLHLRATAVA
ncbi:hypothetical protein R3P38DRAFT_3244573 [Favolaschia claudopus]|uniref:Uncharacterized protein n=1 Tax=Favolaschia claudopus TaxID=2862362 RepID=A0AAV9Z246_9AGAR